jgi:hypothetical protein
MMGLECGTEFAPVLSLLPDTVNVHRQNHDRADTNQADL